MPSDEQMRDQVKRAYPGPAWRAKVNRMSKKQVASVYLRLLDQQPRRLKENR